MELEYEIILPGRGNYDELLGYIKDIDETHIPSISSRVNIEEWVRKLIDHATLFVYRDQGRIVACVADYVNKAPELSFSTHLSCRHEYADHMLGPDLVIKSIKYEQQYGSAGKYGKVRESFRNILKFYTKLGFKVVNKSHFPNSSEVELEIRKLF